VDEYCEKNEGLDRYEIAMPLRRLYEIQNNSLGVIELSANLDMDAIMEIIGRMNKTSVHLHTVDFIKYRMAAGDSP
jgi:ADP-dependent phosphofructokinase/glucokinase